jgi:3-methyladenine DNA glycosylase AlkD
MTNQLIKDLRLTLKNSTDPQTQATFQRFFKEAVLAYGVRAGEVSKISTDYYNQIEDKSKAHVFSLCEDLYQSNYIEEAWIAASWGYKVHAQYTPDDITTFKHWITNYVNDWAKCDGLCNHAVGELVTQYPELIDELKAWAHTDHRWLKRASAVSLIIPAKKGLFLNDVFAIADILLLDKDDLVQKGYGWMLKVASQAHLQPVYEYVYDHKATMPRTALRYAIEKMPAELKAKAMEK